MTKKIVNKFVCDNCREESDEIRNEGEYPYNKRWCYLHELNFKVQSENIEQYKELHFCSSRCMMNFISNMIYMSRCERGGEIKLEL